MMTGTPPDTGDAKPHMKRPEGYVLVENSAWQQFQTPDYSTSQYTGWKVQLSVHPEDLTAAWNLLADHIPEYGIKAVKVATPSSMTVVSNPEEGQSGKMIVIYDTRLADWDKRMLDIEKLFADNAIRPGPAIKDNRPIAGSKYSYWGCTR